MPHAIFTPFAIAFPSMARARGNTSAALAWSSGAALDMSRPSERKLVGTRKVPFSTIIWIVSSSASEPCSMQSTPARMHALMPASPCACAATLMPARCASSTMAASSSSEYCCAPARPLCDITPPEAEILMRRAPYLIW